MASDKPTYRELETQARLDFAMRVISDPQADAEHVEAARQVLETHSDSGLPERDDVRTQMHYCNRDVLRALLGDEQTDPTLDPEFRQRIRRAVGWRD